MNYLLDLSRGRIKPENLPTTSPRCLYIFICSAYTDFRLERRILKESVFPELRQYTRQTYGLDLSVIDPRPMEDIIPLESVNYNKLFKKLCSRYCKSNIDCCPVILLGQKYGLPLLPNRIPDRMYEILTRKFKQKTGNTYFSVTKDFDLAKWYQKDCNVLGEHEWCLKPYDWSGKHFQDQIFQEKSELIRKWNKTKDFLAWLLYYTANLCLKDGLITGSDLDEIFIFELRTAVNSIMEKNDNSIYEDLGESGYSPILLQRQIIDIRTHLNCPEVYRFTDIIPQIPPDLTDTNSLDENQTPQINSLLVSKLNALQNNLLSKWECSLVGSKEQMQIIWRWPNGLSREFHRDYLGRFCDQLKSALTSAIDLRASHKLALLIPTYITPMFNEPHASDQPPETPKTTTPILNLSENHLPNHHHVTREFRKRIHAWDSAWNSISQIQWLYPMALSYKDEVDTVLCYIEDTDPNAEVPMLLYSTIKSNNSIKKGYTCLANCVAAYACKEIQRRYTASEDYILITRSITTCTLLKSLLEDLADQLSIALEMDRARLNTDSLASLVYSISPQNEKLRHGKLIIVLAGIEQLELDQCCETPSGLLPILQAPQIPGRLKNGLKLILAGELHITDIGPKSEDEGILLPATSLNLEIQPQTTGSRFSTCMAHLNQMNRCLMTDQQKFELHKALDQLSSESDSHIMACSLADRVLVNISSDHCISAERLVSQLKQKDASNLIRQTSLWLTSKTSNLMLAMLKLTSNYENHGPGLTSEEMLELLSLSNETVESQTPPEIIDQNLPLFCDSFSIHMFLHFLEDEYIMARLKICPPLCALNGYFIMKFNTTFDLDPSNQQEANLLLSDYFLGTWYNQPKPMTGTPMSSESPVRVITPQSIYFAKSPPKSKIETNILHFDSRYLRHMYLSLLHSKRFAELGSRTLFNFSWLYAKIYVLGVRDILTDIAILDSIIVNSPNEQEWTNSILVLRFEANILADALNRASISITNNPDSLATELVGQLLPSACASDVLVNDLEHVYLASLVRQCDQACPWYGVLVPTYSYPITPGNPLLGSLKCPTPLNNICVSKLQTHSESHVLIKLEHDPVIYRYNCSRQRELDSWRSSCGYLYITPASKYAVIIDELLNDTLKIHQLDIKINSCVPLIGQINIGLWLKALNSENSKFEEPLKIQILQIDLTDLYVGLIVRTKNTLNLITNMDKQEDKMNCDYLSENLAPCDLNYVILFELTTGKPLHMLSPTPLATLIKCCSLSKLSSSLHHEYSNLHDTDHVFFTNSGRQLLGFRIDTGEQFLSISLRSIPQKYLITKDSKRLFTFSHQEPCIIYLHLDSKGSLEKSFRVSFEDILPNDTILDIKIANYMSFVLVHATQNILVYDYESDTIFVHIKRPENIPQRFRLPNSQYQELVFTAVEFGLHDQTVLASLFRNIFIWDIRLGIPLTTLNAPIGIITSLLIDQTGRQLIGYNESLKELYLWDIPLALTNAAMTRRLPNQISQVNKMDRLTKPITNLVCYSIDKPILAFCHQSDELGIFDSQTGQLTDLFTHDGYVMNAELSACGQYALVSISLTSRKKKYCNLVWSLESRTILTEYGTEIGYCMSRKLQGGHFLHFVPQYQDDSDSNFVGYVLKSILVCQCTGPIPRVQIDTIPDVKIHRLVKPCKPFITSDDQHLVLLTLDDKNNISNDNPALTIWTMDQLSDDKCPSGMLWQIQAYELKEKINEDAIYIRILNCCPAPSGSMMLIFYARFDEFPKCYIKENLITGTGLSKGLIVVDLQKFDNAQNVTLTILRSVTGLNSETPMAAIHYSFLNAEIFDSYTGLYYRLPANEKHIAPHSFKQLVPHFKVDNNHMPFHFHGFVLQDNLCLFSSGNFIYLIRPQSRSIVTSIDTHHPITIVQPYATNDRIIMIGSSDGYVLSFNLIDPFYDSAEPTRISNLLKQLPLRSKLCTDQSELNQMIVDSDAEPKVDRSRSWDRTLDQGQEICPNENMTSELVEAIQRQITLMDEDTSGKSSESVDKRATSCSLM